MSVFDSTSGVERADWLKERSLGTLADAVRLVDIANEPGARPSHAKKLKGVAGDLVSQILPMTALFHGAAESAVESEQWQGILERGTFALSRWCSVWGIAPPRHFAKSVTVGQGDEVETVENRRTVRQGQNPDDSKGCNGTTLTIFRRMTLRMVHDGLSEPARRLLSWSLFKLSESNFDDRVVIDKELLPADIGCTPQETHEGYRALCRSGLVEKVEGLELEEGAIALRLVPDGSGRQDLLFEEERFGRKGTWVRGEPTIGDILNLMFDDDLSGLLERMAGSKARLRQLKAFLQQSIGDENAYVEEVKVAVRPIPEGNSVALNLLVRYPLDTDDQLMETRLKAFAEQWLAASQAATAPFGKNRSGGSHGALDENGNPAHAVVIALRPENSRPASQ